MKAGRNGVGIMARRAAYRKKRQNKFGMFLVTTVVAMMLIVVAIKSLELRQKLVAYQDKLGLVHDNEIIFREAD